MPMFSPNCVWLLTFKFMFRLKSFNSFIALVRWVIMYVRYTYTLGNKSVYDLLGFELGPNSATPTCHPSFLQPL